MGDTEGETYLLSIDHKGDALTKKGDCMGNAWFGDVDDSDRTMQWFYAMADTIRLPAGPFSFSSYGTGDYSITFRPVLHESRTLVLSITLPFTKSNRNGH